MGAPTSPRPGTVRTGGRPARVRAAVLAAALEELAEYGYGGMSAARIAQRAGVHRTTVHRRWSALDELVTEALIDDAAAAVPTPDSGDVRQDLALLLRSIAALISAPDTRGLIRSLVADAARSPAIGAVVARVWRARFAAGEKVVARGVSRGEVRDDVPPATILTAFTGPLYLRLLLTDEPLDEAFLDEVLEIGLQGALARPGDARR